MTGGEGTKGHARWIDEGDGAAVDLDEDDAIFIQDKGVP